MVDDGTAARSETERATTGDSGSMNPRRNKLLAKLFLVFVMPAMFFVAVEGVLRMFPLDFETEPAVKIEGSTASFTEEVINNERCYVASNESFRPPQIKIPCDKQQGAFRIVSIGGSASNGLPHAVGNSYLDYLQDLFVQNLPDQNVEVYNFGGSGFASYRLRTFIGQLEQLQPDLVIIYSGNNEFVEARRYATRSGMTWRIRQFIVKTRIGQLLSRSILQTKQIVLNNTVEIAVYDDTIQKKASNLRAEPGQTEIVLLEYEDNIRAIIDEALGWQVPVLLFTIPTNLRDWRPHVSFSKSEGPERVQWLQDFTRGRGCFFDGKYKEAEAAFRKVISVEPLHAESCYFLGRSLEMQGQKESSFEMYLQAKELDYGPFRALNAINETLRKIADEKEQVYLVDLEQEFKSCAEGVAPGFDLFVDYCHPTYRGNRVIANKSFERIMADNLLGISGLTSEEPAIQYHDLRETEPDSVGQYTWNKLFAWYVVLHQHEAIIALSNKLQTVEDGMIAQGTRNHIARWAAVLAEYEGFKNGKYPVKPWVDQAELKKFSVHLDFKRLYHEMIRKSQRENGLPDHKLPWLRDEVY